MLADDRLPLFRFFQEVTPLDDFLVAEAPKIQNGAIDSCSGRHNYRTLKYLQCLISDAFQLCWYQIRDRRVANRKLFMFNGPNWTSLLKRCAVRDRKFACTENGCSGRIPLTLGFKDVSSEFLDGQLAFRPRFQWVYLIGSDCAVRR